MILRNLLQDIVLGKTPIVIKSFMKIFIYHEKNRITEIDIAYIFKI